MPFPFVLPTTSAFSFTSSFVCPSHPSLLRNATTYRGVVRDTLKKHKRLPPDAQASNLALVVSSLQNYLPYLFAVLDGLKGRGGIQVSRKTVTDSAAAAAAAGPATPAGPPKPKSKSPSTVLPIEWRPTLSESRSIPGKEAPRVRVPSLDHELAFALATLGHAYTLQARAALQPLYVVTSVVPVGSQQRLAAITAATKHLLEAASVFTFLGSWTGSSSSGGGGGNSLAAATSPPTSDIAPSVLRAHADLALAEATLLAVLKDDPYPAVVAQDRNENDREWMYKAPDIPKVRAHLFARLCLAAAEHASQAAAGANSSHPALHSAFLRYLTDLQHTSRAKACRFFAIDAELGDQTGTALAWLHAALHELGVEVLSAGGSGSRGDGKSGSGGSSGKGKHLLSRFKKERSEKKEDRRVERGQGWGGDAGRLEETRVLEMLDAKWTKQNDTMNTQLIPPAGPLLAQMPSGREIHTIKAYEPPALDASELDAMRAPPDPLDELEQDGLDGGASSSDEDGSAPSSRNTPVGAYPGAGRSSYF